MSASMKTQTTVLPAHPFQGLPWFILALAASLGVVACSRDTAPAPSPSPALQPAAEADALIDGLSDDKLFEDLSQLVAIRTYRDRDVLEKDVVTNLQQLRALLMRQAEEFNKGQKVHKLVPFEWKPRREKTDEDGTEHQYWLFGLRLGSGPKKIMLSSHLDTVPPGDNPNWEPFKLKREMRSHLGEKKEFYVGRGAIDDKGPALVAFRVLQQVARRYDGSSKLDGVTLELIFDTSEETDMAMPHYLEQNPGQRPDLGVIYDASWCVHAEKGIERPKFTLKRRGRGPTPSGLWIESLETPSGPENQIPDRATAVIRASSPEELRRFSLEADKLYQAHPFDDPTYRRANLTVDTRSKPGSVLLITEVAGAQHGSAPDENREHGANPLVSLANFLGGLVEQGKLARTEAGELCRFITWAWGTRVFGEHHPALLQASDSVFKPGNGTTYAVTRVQARAPADSADGIAATLQVDVRYALGHHEKPWDGKSEGFVGGKASESRFKQVFGELLRRFPGSPGYELSVETATSFPPDIRLPEGKAFSRVGSAYLQAMKERCPARAIGGGTDAKGNPNLIAAGALFTGFMGPPINYHGFNEGAPVEDLQQGARILQALFVQEIENAASPPQAAR